MMRRGNGGEADRGNGQDRLSRAQYRELDDANLIDAMRRQDPRAIEEFIVRAQRVIHDRATWSGLSHEEYEDCTVDVVDDVALLITTGRIRPTRSLAAYVMKVFRTRMAQRAREERDRQGRAREASNDDSDARGLAALSDDTWRSSRPSDDEGSLPVSSVATRLAELVDGGITPEERKILQWLSAYVPQRDICAWLGVSYAAGTQRMWRLRERLKKTALDHAWAFTEGERKELERLLRSRGEREAKRQKKRGATQ